ncbi:MAG: type II toxin-antitoxin system mRNA interferase toxin, RelE/StbE family [Candidatus Shapirobacteria bacterium]|jgi:mRNA-degrading endonuclease YafQ of YafQ-DinJ toxin-antitoxin module
MKLYFTPIFLKKLHKSRRSQPKLAAKIRQSLDDLTDNPNTNSLRLHKLSGKNGDVWSISLNRSLRLTFTYVPDGILLLNFGKHEEVY